MISLKLIPSRAACRLARLAISSFSVNVVRTKHHHVLVSDVKKLVTELDRECRGENFGTISFTSGFPARQIFTGRHALDSVLSLRLCALGPTKP
jgi:hypothetical protein